MKKTFVCGALLMSSLLGGCAMMGTGGGPRGVADCTMAQCRPIVVSVNAGCHVNAPAQYHVAGLPPGTAVTITWVLGQGANAFDSNGIFVKSGQATVSGGPARWTMQETFTPGTSITYGIKVKDGNGVLCNLDPDIINDM